MSIDNPIPFADLTLSRRLERAEGRACVEYAEARSLLHPETGAEWMECGGAYAAFDGVESPVTQTFGLGLFEELTETTLDSIERFFQAHGAPVFHEVSPFAGITTLQLLCKRRYVPIELSSVMYRTVEAPTQHPPEGIKVRITTPDEAALWSDISAQGWAHEHPEFREFLLNLGQITAARKQSLCFLAELDGVPGAAGVLSIHEGVALFGGSSTIPDLRRQGLQSALLHERMRYAFEHGCDLAMMVALPGSDSQRNAERKGFRIAYTRTKWQLQG